MAVARIYAVQRCDRRFLRLREHAFKSSPGNETPISLKNTVAGKVSRKDGKSGVAATVTRARLLVFVPSCNGCRLRHRNIPLLHVIDETFFHHV
eukprot:5304331-Amphidinium_carterae.1